MKDYAQNAQTNLAPQGEPANELEDFANRLRGIEHDAELIADRLQRMISRAFGEGVADGKKSSPPIAAGSVGAIHALLTSIGTNLVTASEAITRLDKLA